MTDGRRKPLGAGGGVGMTPEQAFALAGEIAQQSACTRSHVGAVLVDLFGGFLGMGYNQGADCAALCPRGKFTHEQVPSTAPYEGETLCISWHAEAAAVHQARQTDPGIKLAGSMLYSTHEPCSECRPVLERLGISCMWLGMTS